MAKSTSRLVLILIAIVFCIFLGLTTNITVNPESDESSSTKVSSSCEPLSAAHHALKKNDETKQCESSLAYHRSPVVIAECHGRPGFKMSLPNYPHLRHWLLDATQNKPINIGADYLRYQEMFLMKRFSSEAIMIDVGCNHGLAALPVAALGHRVICFEPVRYNYEKLLQSNLFNKFKYPMKIIHAALGDRSSNVSIFVPASRDDNASLDPVASTSNLPNSKIETETVSMTTLDEFLNSNSNNRELRQSFIEFIKIDVQGFEEFVLKGAQNFLQRACVKIIIECEFSPKMIRARGGNPLSLLTFMYDRGFHFSWNKIFQGPKDFVAFIQNIGDSQVDIEFFKNKR